MSYADQGLIPSPVGTDQRDKLLEQSSGRKPSTHEESRYNRRRYSRELALQD
jgi:hypothetical protein